MSKPSQKGLHGQKETSDAAQPGQFADASFTHPLRLGLYRRRPTNEPGRRDDRVRGESGVALKDK